MNISIRYILLAIALSLGLATPPTTTYAQEPAQPPVWAVYNKMADTMPLSTIQPLEPLKMADFKYAPMGTYTNAFPDSSQCVWGVASMKGNISWRGNANQWDDQARARGITVSSVPVVGSVAQTDRGSYGHVATVVGVGDGTVTVVEKNYNFMGGVRTYSYPVSKFVYIYI